MRITPIRRPVVSKPSPSPHLATIASGATTVSVRAAAVADAIQSWTHRIPLNVSVSCEGFSQELRACEASLASSRTSFSRSARRLTAARCSLYDKRLEEIDAVFKLLSALARTLTAHLSRCASSVQCDGLMSWIGPLLSINPFYVHSCMIHIGNDSLPLDTITRCRHGDRILLTVSPQHSSRFWSYTRENTLQITCVDDEGCPFPQVLPADVQAHFSPPIASICVNAIAEPGTLALKYSVPSAVTGPLTINVEMFGVNVHSSVVQSMSGHRLSGMCVATHSPVPPSGEASHLSGIAVHPLGTVLMLCSNNGRSLHCLHTFSLPSCSPIASFAGKGTRPGDVYCPRKIGYSPDGNTVFVAEDRVPSPVVQELSSSNGDHLRFIGEGQIGRGLSGLAVGEHLIAVGRWSSDSDAVVLFERSSGAFLRSFGGCGLTPGMMRSVTGTRFTQDGSHIVAAEYLNCRASVFNVSGVFVKCVGKGTATTPFDVEICPNGDVIVPDVGKVSTRVRVCDDGTEPVLSLSPTGASGKGFPAPVTALAYHNDTATLYVLDERGAVYVYQ